MATTTVENYVKQLYLAQQQGSASLVSMGELARRMDVTPGTATSMMKTLAESGLVDYEPRTGVRLRTGGEKLALVILRRHRLIEQFLVEVVGLDWSEVHEEAEHLEHVISDKILARMDELLGHPRTDPHGDPIPDANGVILKPDTVALPGCATGSRQRVVRVVDQDPEFLQFIDECGLAPGAELTVVQQDARADATTVTPQRGGRITLGTAAATKLLVQAV